MDTSSSTFVNPIGEGADPWVIQDPIHPERYLWCMSEGNRAIAIHTSPRLTSLGQKHVVWRAPSDGPVSRQVWAPELHFLENKWNIYFAASDGRNESHLTYVLQSEGSDPLGEYQLSEPLATGDGDDGRSPNGWAIDMTVMELLNKKYAVWSGWDAPGTDRQFLYIARLESPTEIIPPRVCLCKNDDYLWERIKPERQERGLSEAPQVLQLNGKTFIVYSCGASWLSTYKLGLLELVGENPMDPRAWKKHDAPVFHGNGTGHACFVKSLDDKELWLVYHAKWDDKPGWRRAIYLQPITVNKSDGMPLFGSPVQAGSELPLPSGETIPTIELPHRESFRDEHTSLLDWSYYGHHQFISQSSEKLHLGVIPQEPVNEFRCGEKIILDKRLPLNYSVEVTIHFGGDSKRAAGQAGILFRCSKASLGYDSQCGYFAGLFPQKQSLVVGKMNGKEWKELGHASCDILVDAPQRLQVKVSGSHFAIFHNGRRRLVVADDMYRNGFVGLRVVDTHAMFNGFVVDLLGSD